MRFSSGTSFFTMPTVKESEANDFKLAQYWSINHCSSEDGYAEKIFSNEFYVDCRLLAMECVGSEYSEMIGCTALHLAARLNRTVDIQFLLSRNASLFIKDQNDCTPLHWSVKNNCEHPDYSLEIQSSSALLLSAQLKSGNSENPSDKYGLTHFHIACMADHADAVEFFLKHGIQIDQTVNMDSPYVPGCTPLHLAAKYSALEAMKVLLKYRANTQLKDAEGMTFICKLFEFRIEILQHLSINSKHFDDSDTVAANLKIMNFLLQSDDCHMIDYFGLTYFHLACSMSELSLAEQLLPKITDINQALDMDAPKWSGYTALHFAAQSSLEMIKMLVKNGANILAKDAKGMTPVDICLKQYGLEDIHAILALDTNFNSIVMSDRKTRLLSLIFAMKDANLFCNFLQPRINLVNTFVPLDSPLWQGFTPLHIAVMFYEVNKQFLRIDERSAKIISKLVEKGANINTQDIHGWSPIHLSFRLKPQTCTRILLNFNDKIENVIDQDNLSHLHIFCKLKPNRSIEKLLNNSTHINVAFKGKSKVPGLCLGATPLHCAATNDKLVNSLLLHGADPYLEDAQGMTPIHHSAGRSKAILSIPNLKEVVVKDSGLSHLHIAVRCKNVAAVEKLLDEGANINQALVQENVLSSISRSLNNIEGETSLDLAIANKDKKMIELLLRRGAEIRTKAVFVNEETPDVLESIVSSLDLNDNLFKDLEKEIGITPLHLACFKKDINLIKALLASGANVNAQIGLRSRIWSGFTPLHVIMNDDDHEQNLDEIVRLLLDYGADITLGTCDRQKTPLYMAYEKIPTNSPSNRYSIIKMMLRAHKEFAVNPSDNSGLSYFHVACSIGDIDIVKTFLQNGIDVNQRTKFYETICTLRCNSIACTPLHFVAASTEHVMDPSTQLEMVDLLLNYGADVNAQDVHGNTPIHFMAQWNHKREDVILRLIRSNGNVNSKNVRDETPLVLLMKSGKDVTMYDIKCFLKSGCVFNVFDQASNRGFIAKVLTWISREGLAYFLKSSMITFSQLMHVDEMGRTAIHNIVSNTNELIHNRPSLSHDHYATAITELVKFDCQVDDQDNSGKTALHNAVLFRNLEAITALLMTGADVNVFDLNGKTAFSHIFETCRVNCLDKKNFIERQRHNQYDHFDIFSSFMIHMKKLLICGLHVNQINEKLMFEAFEKFNNKEMIVPEEFQEQIKEIKNSKIPGSRLALENFLSETNAIVAYIIVPQTERDAIDKFFRNNMCDLRNKYNHVAGILFLQYQKAVKRIELNESARLALNILSKRLVPDVCSREILKHLTNSELSSMIKSAAWNV